MAGMSGLRDATYSTSSGKDVKQTKMLSNGARPTKAWKEKNSTTEYKTGGFDHGPLGGKNARK